MYLALTLSRLFVDRITTIKICTRLEIWLRYFTVLKSKGLVKVRVIPTKISMIFTSETSENGAK